MNNEDIKQIIITDDKLTKQIVCNKEIKMRVETKTWNLNKEELTHQKQLEVLMSNNFTKNNDKYILTLITHIKNKIYNYKQQDIIKKKLNENEFVSFEETLNLLKTNQMKCVYCNDNIYILYERVREMKQWSLDRINNDLGHNIGNLVVACLDCNLKRRRTNKDSFMFTKNMVIIKQDNIT